jgi:hypothetical protein
MSRVHCECSQSRDTLEVRSSAVAFRTPGIAGRGMSGVLTPVSSELADAFRLRLPVSKRLEAHKNVVAICASDIFVLTPVVARSVTCSLLQPCRSSGSGTPPS